MPSRRTLTTLQSKVVVPMVAVVGGAAKWSSWTMNKAQLVQMCQEESVLLTSFSSIPRAEEREPSSSMSTTDTSDKEEEESSTTEASDKEEKSEAIRLLHVPHATPIGRKDPEPPPGYKRALGTSKDITMAKECRTRVNVLPVLDHSEDSKLDKIKEQDFVLENITNNLEDTGDEKLERREEITQPPEQSNPLNKC